MSTERKKFTRNWWNFAGLYFILYLTQIWKQNWKISDGFITTANQVSRLERHNNWKNKTLVSLGANIQINGLPKYFRRKFRNYERKNLNEPQLGLKCSLPINGSCRIIFSRIQIPRSNHILWTNLTWLRK